jgi:glutamate/tyrosine decarboxylase-like PLP-dependent enzyme
VSTRRLFERTAACAADFVESLPTRPVEAQADVEELRASLGGPLPERSSDPERVISELAAAAEPGLVGMAGGRYFGFVIGGGVPAAVAADWLTSVWDQNAGLYVGGPAASVVEEVAADWLRDLLGLPLGVSTGFVTGCQMAHVTALAAARWQVLSETGWDVGREGLAGAPRIRVLAGEQRHVTIDRALRLLGLGTASVEPVPSDGQGRMEAEPLRRALASGGGPTIVCAQLGNVNTGAFDPLPAIAEAATEAGVWLHVDGAFGMWAAASPRLRHLCEGVERADSWATDAHKWLNVPYDSGIAFCAHPAAHHAAMAVQADYLIHDEERLRRDQMDWVPEFSRRARGFPVYAALRSLGRRGVAELVERCCSCALRFAELLGAEDGVEILNDVVLNQVLVRIGDGQTTDEVMRLVRESGEAWVSGTKWGGESAMRISVSNWQTADAEVDRAVEAIRQAASIAARSVAT